MLMVKPGLIANSCPSRPCRCPGRQLSKMRFISSRQTKPAGAGLKPRVTRQVMVMRLNRLCTAFLEREKLRREMEAVRLVDQCRQIIQQEVSAFFSLSYASADSFVRHLLTPKGSAPLSELFMSHFFTRENFRAFLANLLHRLDHEAVEQFGPRAAGLFEGVKLEQRNVSLTGLQASLNGHRRFLFMIRAMERVLNRTINQALGKLVPLAQSLKINWSGYLMQLAGTGPQMEEERCCRHLVGQVTGIIRNMESELTDYLTNQVAPLVYEWFDKNIAPVYDAKLDRLNKFTDHVECKRHTA